MPQPVSATSMTRCSGVSDVRMSSSPPSGMAAKALLIRLVSTWTSWSGSRSQSFVAWPGSTRTAHRPRRRHALHALVDQLAHVDGLQQAPCSGGRSRAGRPRCACSGRPARTIICRSSRTVGVGRQFVQQQVGVHQHHAERIVELVGDAAASCPMLARRSECISCSCVLASFSSRRLQLVDGALELARSRTAGTSRSRPAPC